MKPNFEIELLPEAIEFLEAVDEKTREKIYYNIKKAQFVHDDELFKKLNDFIWEFRTLYTAIISALFILGQIGRARNFSGCNSQNTQKDTENATERN